MGLGGISIWQLLIILVIVLLLFGTKRLRGLGGDLGGAIKGFKKAIKDDKQENGKDAETDAQQQTDADSAEPDTDQTDSAASDDHKQKSETKQ